jgi:phosphate acyltransferase
MITLAVDCMGGDHGPAVTLPASVRFLEAHPDAQLIMVGLPEALAGHAHPRTRVLHASEVVLMDDPIEIALRKKKDSSMRLAIQQVKDGNAGAAISAGNTGALMAIARYLLKTLEGIDRPAIATQLPNSKGGATTSIARPPICFSSQSWAQPWCPSSRASTPHASACSTLGRR